MTLQRAARIVGNYCWSQLSCTAEATFPGSWALWGWLLNEEDETVPGRCISLGAAASCFATASWQVSFLLPSLESQLQLGVLESFVSTPWGCVEAMVVFPRN